MKNNPLLSQQDIVSIHLEQLSKSYSNAIQNPLGNSEIKHCFYILLTIARHNQTLTQQAIANKLHLDKSAMVRIIDKLTSLGYLERQKMKNDRRAYRITLTPKAKNELPEINNALKQAHSLAFSGLTKQQVKQFFTTLKTIENNLSKLY